MASTRGVAEAATKSLLMSIRRVLYTLKCNVYQPGDPSHRLLGLRCQALTGAEHAAGFGGSGGGRTLREARRSSRSRHKLEQLVLKLRPWPQGVFAWSGLQIS